MRKLTAIILCLSIFCSLFIPTAYAEPDETQPEQTDPVEQSTEPASQDTPVYPVGSIHTQDSAIPADTTISDELLITGDCPRQIVLNNVAIQGKLVVDAEHAVELLFEGNSFANTMEIRSTVRLVGGNHGTITTEGASFSITGGSADSITIAGDNAIATVHTDVGSVVLGGRNILLSGSGYAGSVEVTGSGCQVELSSGNVEEALKTDFQNIDGIVTVETPVVSPADSVVRASVTFTNVPVDMNCTLQWFIGDTLVYTDWNFNLTADKTSTMAYSAHFNEETPESLPVFVQLTSNTNRDDQKRIVGRVLTECKRADYYESIQGLEKPFEIEVYRDKNIIVVWGLDDSGQYTDLVNAFPCSVGVMDKSPKGTFYTDKIYRWTMLYGEVWGQYCTHITTKYLFHSVPYYSQSNRELEWDQYNKLGSPASAGCIRLSTIDAKWIYDHCPLGTKVSLFNYNDKFGKDAALPVVKPIAASINTSSRLRGWDPTDPDPANPTKAVDPPLSEVLPVVCVETSVRYPA